MGGSTEEMQALNEAYAVLRDADARAEYEETLPPRTIGRTIRVEMPAVMPWGKHAGTAMEDVPSGYFRWILRKADYASADLKAEIREELDRRRAETSGVEYVQRNSCVVHLSIGGDPPLCGSWWGFRGNESHSSEWPGGEPCKKGCFK